MNTSARPVYLAGRGLACTLGNTLAECTARLAEPAASTQSVPCGDLGELPVFGMSWLPSNTPAEWYAQAREHILRVASEAGLPTHADAPLFIASSSINMGEMELGASCQQDHAFGEVDRFAEILGWRGPVYWINTACTSALNAILSAHSLVSGGLCDDAVVLALELPNRFTTRGFAAMQLLTRERPQPLGAARSGLMLSEAVVALHLTSRPADWQITGGANIVDGADPTGASVSAITRCWQQALAGSTVDLIKLQASGSPLNDQKEITALEQLALQPAPALLSLKAAMGHSLGASGAAELALLSAGLDAGLSAVSWPQIDYLQDESLSRTLSPQAPERRDSALLSIIGFGGSHAALGLCRPRPITAPSGQLTPREFAVIARQTDAPPADWQSTLHIMLGERPRRLGNWVELGLWGALLCLRSAGIEQPDNDMLIRVATLDGPRKAIYKALDESLASGTPMPFSFLQSQPSQLLANLARALHWQGDARMVTHRDPHTLIRLALSEVQHSGQDVLLGWLEEESATAPAHSRWLLLRAQAYGDEVWLDDGVENDIWSARSFRPADGTLLQR